MNAPKEFHSQKSSEDANLKEARGWLNCQLDSRGRWGLTISSGEVLREKILYIVLISLLSPLREFLYCSDLHTPPPVSKLESFSFSENGRSLAYPHEDKLAELHILYYQQIRQPRLSEPVLHDIPFRPRSHEWIYITLVRRRPFNTLDARVAVVSPYWKSKIENPIQR